MLILTLRTDKPEAEVGLYSDSKKADYIIWQAHRELSATIHLKIKEILDKSNYDLKDLNGVLIYKGPGSFTGLRIGFSVANALSYGLGINVVSELDEDWIEHGIERLINKENDYIAMPTYGAEPNITKPKK